MDAKTAAASAVAGAVVALVVTEVAKKFNQAKVDKQLTAAVENAWVDGRRQGYFEGRDSIVQEFKQVPEPHDFTTSR